MSDKIARTIIYTYLQRVRTKQERRALGEDMNLPLPVSVHVLGQHALRTHEFERILDPEIPAKSGTGELSVRCMC